MAEAVVSMDVVVVTTGLLLTPEETRALQAVWNAEALVDWDAYDRARARIRGWRPAETHVSTVPPAP